MNKNKHYLISDASRQVQVEAHVLRYWEDELGLPCVLTIEGKNHKIAETIVENTAEKNQKMLTMDSMQSTTSEDVANGTTYLSVMEQNLGVLKEALD